MKNKKQMQSIINRAVESCFESGKLKEKKALQFVSLFKKMPGTGAIIFLSMFLKGLKNRLDSVTMIVESAVSVSSLELRRIKNKFDSKFLIHNSKFNLDPSLIAGLRVKIGDYVFEDSIRSRLCQIKEVIHG